MTVANYFTLGSFQISVVFNQTELNLKCCNESLFYWFKIVVFV